MSILCQFCLCHPDGEVEVPATVIAPQANADNSDPKWVPACDSHWSTWWIGGDHEAPESRLPVFSLETLTVIPVSEHPPVE